MPVPNRLRDLIRNVRSCKTAADEREVIQKECADIRNCFREEDNVFRCRNVAKVLYIYMLGYPSHFGQLEALKLIVSSRFTDKRFGYLGAMLLLDEHREVHLLMTNSLKNDMGHTSQYVQSLALCTLGNVCSTEMARDLALDVEKLMKNGNSYIKKKRYILWFSSWGVRLCNTLQRQLSNHWHLVDGIIYRQEYFNRRKFHSVNFGDWVCVSGSKPLQVCKTTRIKLPKGYLSLMAILCACRIVRKVPEMIENYMPLTKSLLVDKNHGVMLATVALITAMCKIDSSVRSSFKKLVPTLVRTLKNLIMAGYSPEHDVSGISDPFLQVRVIRLLRILGQNDAESSEIMNDVLAQVATNTETSKNVGNAILYETVITIMEIKSESGLRVLAVNILGRFLLNNDKNIRYVALNSLLKTVHTDMTAVQRHRTTILDCLKDPDLSILRPAMALCFALVNKTNVRGTVRELITFLSNCPLDFKGDCSSGIFLAAEKYSPNTRWHIDTMLKVLTTAGNYVRDDVVPSLIHLLSATDKMHAYATNKLYQAMVDVADVSVLPLAQVTCWCLGEYGDELLAGYGAEEELVKVTETEVLELLEDILKSSLTNSITKSYAINAVVKLSARFPSHKNEVENIVSKYSTCHNMEVQQRAVEYSALFKKHDHLRPGVLEHMPQFERTSKPENNEDNSEADDPVPQESSTPTPHPPPAQEMSNVDLLLDLVDIGGPAPTSQPPLTVPMGNDLGNILDLGLSSMQVLPQQPMPISMNGYTHPPQVNSGDLLSGLDGSMTQNSTNLITDSFVQKPVDSVVAFDKGGLKITFTFAREPSTTVTSIKLSAANSTNVDFNNFIFQAAVPKSFQLQILPPSGSVVSANHGNVVNQTVKINNPNKVQPRLRMRIAYTSSGSNVQEMEEFNNFPPLTWQ